MNCSVLKTKNNGIGIYRDSTLLLLGLIYSFQRDRLRLHLTASYLQFLPFFIDYPCRYKDFLPYWFKTSHLAKALLSPVFSYIAAAQSTTELLW